MTARAAMSFFSDLYALLPHVFSLRISANSHLNATFRYFWGKVNVVIERHLNAPTPTNLASLVHKPTPAPKGPYPFVSLPLHRPHYLAAHSITGTSSKFTLFHICIFGYIVLFVCLAYTVCSQSSRLVELEEADIAAQANFDVVEKNFRRAEKAHRKQAVIMEQKFALVASFVEQTKRRADDADEKVEGLLQRIDTLTKQKVQDEEMRMASDRRTQQQLKEEAKKNILKEFQENNLARSKEHEGYMASLEASASAEEFPKNAILAELKESEKRSQKWTTEMIWKSEKHWAEDTNKLGAEHRMDLQQIKSESFKREAHYAQEINKLRGQNVERYDALLSCVEEAMVKDGLARIQERKMEREARLVEKKEEQAVLSKMRLDIGRSANSILELKTKLMVRLMEQLRVKTEVHDQLRTLHKSVGECQRGLDLVLKQRRGHEIATIPTTTFHRPSSPELPHQGLLTPATSQSPPPHQFPPEQVATTISYRGQFAEALSGTRVKQEEASFDLHRGVYELSKREAKVGIGIPSEHKLSLNQSISLSDISNGENLLSVSPPWPDTSLSESPSLDHAFCRGRTLANDSSLPKSDNLRGVSLPQWLQTESPESVYEVQHPLDDSIMLSDIALSSDCDLKEISPPQWLHGVPPPAVKIPQVPDSVKPIAESVFETDNSDSAFSTGRPSDSPLLLSTNKAGIKIKFHSPTPSPSKYPVSSLGDFGDDSGYFRPRCMSSPSAPRELKIITGSDDSSFACAHKGFLPASSSWLGCHLAISEFRGAGERKPAKQEGKGHVCVSVPRVVLEKNLPAPHYPSMSAYLPALTSTSVVVEATRLTSPSPTKAIVINESVLPVLQKVVSKAKRRKSYGDKHPVSAAFEQDLHHHSLPAIVSDLFNPV